MSSVWALNIVPGESISIPSDGAIQLSHATLSLDPHVGRTVLLAVVNNIEYALCVLQKDVVETQRLTHCFLPNDRATLKVIGTNNIQIIGNLIQLQEPEFDMDESTDENRLEQLALMRPQCGSPSHEEEIIEQPVQKRSVHFELATDLSDEDDEDDEDYIEASEEEDYIDNSDEEAEEISGNENEEEETVTGEPQYANYLSDLLGPDLPDEDDEDYHFEQMSDDYGTLAFRDPSDNDFLGGFELRHFNLVPNYPGFEKVDLREQEKTQEDTLLHDNIARGLVNALLNSGDKIQVGKGKELQKKLRKQCKNRKACK
ncbi:hypothetical protein BY458DRAFT_584974 [Sporodiniella umbellata]|nr:hypothetical protein BY458DRAFT_584974 [Sporodiniella umbellata]